MSTRLHNFLRVILILTVAVVPTAVMAWENHDPVFVIDPVSVPTVTTLVLEC